MTTLNRFGLMGREHWREHCPRLYALLEREGRLEPALVLAQEATMRDMATLEAQGLTSDEAWEATRELYLILREEPGVSPNPPRCFGYETLAEGEKSLRKLLNRDSD